MEKNNLKSFFIKIWPAIYRMINDFLYFIINLIKNTVKYAIRQIKGE